MRVAVVPDLSESPFVEPRLPPDNFYDRRLQPLLLAHQFVHLVVVVRRLRLLCVELLGNGVWVTADEIHGEAAPPCSSSPSIRAEKSTGLFAIAPLKLDQRQLPLPLLGSSALNHVAVEHSFIALARGGGNRRRP